MAVYDASQITEDFQLVTRSGGSAGEQHMVNGLIINLYGGRQGDEKSAEMEFLLAPAVGDGEVIDNQVLAFAFRAQIRSASSSVMWAWLTNRSQICLVMVFQSSLGRFG